MKVVNGDGILVIVTEDEEETENIVERLSCSSFKTFDQHRKDKGLSGLARQQVWAPVAKAING